MKILLTRDSVCAADDIDACHPFAISVEDGSSPMQILQAIRASDYLPNIGGGNATWVASSISPIGVYCAAVAKSQDQLENFAGYAGLDWSDGDLRVHVSYLAGEIDRESALSVVEHLNLRPDVVQFSAH